MLSGTGKTFGKKRERAAFQLSPGQVLVSALLGGTLCAAASLIFFRSLPVSAVLFASGLAGGPAWYRRRLGEKRTRQLQTEWKDALSCLLVALRAGRSLEGAFIAAREDMDPKLMPLVYPVWGQIVKEIRIGYPVEESLRRAAEKSGLPELKSLARSVEICKRSEGDVASVMAHTISVLEERLSFKAQLSVLLARKKLEQRIMDVMPLVILGMLAIMSPGYLSPLYETLKGRLVMAVCAALTIFSLVLSRKISHIEY